MLVGLTTSCDYEKLKKVLVTSRLIMAGFYGLTEEDKEDILIDVMYRFEVDKARFPVSVYARHCRNKIIGFLGKKTAKKRMNQILVDGKIVYIQDISLDAKMDDESNAEMIDLIPTEDDRLKLVEFRLDIEQTYPKLLPYVDKVLQGDALTRVDKKEVKRIFKEGMEDEVGL